jgi:hypothetical protein
MRMKNQGSRIKEEGGRIKEKGRGGSRAWLLF